jgi:hypothetical protein
MPDGEEVKDNEDILQEDDDPGEFTEGDEEDDE